MSTSYVILQRVPDTDAWEYFAAATGDSAARAITTAAKAAGEYVAVPARSWKPLTVKTEQVTVVSIV